MNLKQLFCKHIWKEIKEVQLRERKERIGVLNYDYVYYAKFEECIICNKTRIREVKYWNP